MLTSHFHSYQQTERLGFLVVFIFPWEICAAGREDPFWTYAFCPAALVMLGRREAVPGPRRGSLLLSVLSCLHPLCWDCPITAPCGVTEAEK